MDPNSFFKILESMEPAPFLLVVSFLQYYIRILAVGSFVKSLCYCPYLSLHMYDTKEL